MYFAYDCSVGKGALHIHVSRLSQLTKEQSKQVSALACIANRRMV